MKTFLKRYKFALLLVAINVFMLIFMPELGKTSVSLAKTNISEMLSVLPPIFVLLGLMDVWVEKETMMRFLGKGSGLRGLLIAFVLGSASAGPLYGAFPVATVMMRKGASLFNVFIFVGAWSTTKIPMLAFELSNLGPAFMFTRLGLSIVGVMLIAFLTDKGLSAEEQAEMYARSE